MKALVLEDDHNRARKFKQRFLERGWSGIFTETAKEAIEHLKTTDFDIVFLDHDLGGEVFVNTDGSNTGSEVARWMAKNPKKGYVVIHSLNTPAALVMQRLIPGSYHIPFVWEESIFNGSIH